MSDLEKNISETMARVRESLGLPENTAPPKLPARWSSNGPSWAELTAPSAPAPPVGRKPVETLAVGDNGPEALFLAKVAPGSELAARFPEPIERTLARRVYLVHSVWRFYGVRMACATLDGQLVTETAKIHKLATLVVD